MTPPSSAPSTNQEGVQRTPTRPIGRPSKRKLQTGGTPGPELSADEKPLAAKRRRHSSSLSCTASPTSLLKPAMTERQQMALLLQMTDPQKCHTPPRTGTSSVESSPRDTPGRSKVHKRNERGETPLHLACIKGDLNAVMLLIEQGADINAIDNAGWTPLHEASNHGYVKIVSVLVDKGAYVNAPGMGGETPLHDAVINDHIDVVKLLLRGGADPYITNAKGKTPIDTCTSDTIHSILRNVARNEIKENDEEKDVFLDDFERKTDSSPHPLLLTRTPPSSRVPSTKVLTPHIRIKGRSHRKVNSRGSFYSDISSSESEADYGEKTGSIGLELGPKILKLSRVLSDEVPSADNSEVPVTPVRKSRAVTPPTSECFSSSNGHCHGNEDGGKRSNGLVENGRAEEEEKHREVDEPASSEDVSDRGSDGHGNQNGDTVSVPSEEAVVVGEGQGTDNEESLSSKPVTPPEDHRQDDGSQINGDGGQDGVVGDDNDGGIRDDGGDDGRVNEDNGENGDDGRDENGSNGMETTDGDISKSGSCENENGDIGENGNEDKDENGDDGKNEDDGKTEEDSGDNGFELNDTNSDSGMNNNEQNGNSGNHGNSDNDVTLAAPLTSPSDGEIASLLVQFSLEVVKMPETKAASDDTTEKGAEPMEIGTPQDVGTTAQQGEMEDTSSLPLSKTSSPAPDNNSDSISVCGSDEMSRACSLSITSGSVRRVSSITEDSTTCGSFTPRLSLDTLALDDSDNEDSCSTIVSFSTSLPLVFNCRSAPQSPKRRSLSPNAVVGGAKDDASVGLRSKKLKLTPQPPLHNHSNGSHGNGNHGNKVKQETTKSTPPYNLILPPKRRALREVYRSRRVSPHQSPPFSPPHNYDTFLLSTRQYKSQSLPQPTSPQDIYPPLASSLHKLFVEQETERMSLLASHLTQVDRLVLSFEQELLRAHQKASSPVPPTNVCSILLDRFLPHKEENSTPQSSLMKGGTLFSPTARDERLLSGYIQDVWDKYHKQSVTMACRHKSEVETLWLMQVYQWRERLKEATPISPTLSSDVPSTHVPVAHSGTFPTYFH